MSKQYLGDAVYATFDGYHVVLATNDGLRDTNKIYLDPAVVAALQNYLKPGAPYEQ